jgi:3-hydroxybutyrate dehydrogenase
MGKKNEKVFITGGTGSVGISLIETFFNKGYSVYFQFSSNENRAKKIEASYNAKSIKIDFKQDFNLPDIDFDVIVNNTGINISDALVHEVDELIWNETLAVNLSAPFKICKYYLPKMIENKWGRIININSIYGLRGVENNSPYIVSKHGLTGLTKSIAKEYAIYGITCNQICPGAIESELMDRIAERVAKEDGTTAKGFLLEVASSYPSKRMVMPNEVSSLALFLASKEASFINGSSIPVDGGLIC